MAGFADVSRSRFWLVALAGVWVGVGAPVSVVLLANSHDSSADNYGSPAARSLCTIRRSHTLRPGP